jgi:hypothetical protein
VDQAGGDFAEGSEFVALDEGALESVHFLFVALCTVLSVDEADGRGQDVGAGFDGLGDVGVVGIERGVVGSAVQASGFRAARKRDPTLVGMGGEQNGVLAPRVLREIVEGGNGENDGPMVVVGWDSDSQGISWEKLVQFPQESGDGFREGVGGRYLTEAGQEPFEHEAACL